MSPHIFKHIQNRLCTFPDHKYAVKLVFVSGQAIAVDDFKKLDASDGYLTEMLPNGKHLFMDLYNLVYIEEINDGVNCKKDIEK